MAAVTVHLVRHGETDWNVEGRLQGWTDIPLNDTGRRQAAGAASLLAGRKIGSVVSSDLSRARDTAAAIAGRVGVDVVTDPALRERSYGIAEGRLNSELELDFGGRLAERWADPDFAFEGGETRRDVYVRLSAYLGDTLAAASTQEVVVVSHGGALRIALAVLEGLSVEQAPPRSFANAEIVTLVLADQPRLIY